MKPTSKFGNCQMTPFSTQRLGIAGFDVTFKAPEPTFVRLERFDAGWTRLGPIRFPWMVVGPL